MTNVQIEEFSKLELVYLEKVKEQDVSEQIRMMELIFFWLQKQMDAARMYIISKLPADQKRKVRKELTAVQKKQFAELQMVMVHVAMEGEREEMAEVEIRMREWLTDQISKATDGLFRPQMKIIRDEQKN